MTRGCENKYLLRHVVLMSLLSPSKNPQHYHYQIQHKKQTNKNFYTRLRQEVSGLDSIKGTDV